MYEMWWRGEKRYEKNGNRGIKGAERKEKGEERGRKRGKRRAEWRRMKRGMRRSGDRGKWERREK